MRTISARGRSTGIRIGGTPVGATRRRRAVAALVALALVTPLGVHIADAQSPAQTANLCGTNDLPETGLQGDVPLADQQSRRAEQGYNCGISLVGHATLGNLGRSPGGNANMAWSGNCAYVAGGGAVFGRGTASANQGVAVVDVSDPTHPQHVGTLTSPGSSLSSETIHAVDVAGPNPRHVLVTGEYGNQSGGGKPMDVFDVTDCAHPRLLETFVWPENIHNLTISGNGRYVFATQPLQVVDLDPLFDTNPLTGIKLLGNLEQAIDYPVVAVGPVADVDDAAPGVRRNGDLCRQSSCYESHEAWPSDDGTRLVLGGQLPTFDVFTVVDIGPWLADPAHGTTHVLGQREGRGHSIRTATINGKEYALHSEESPFSTAYGCLPSEANPFAGVAEPWLSDISDPTNPKMRVSQFHLEINKPENCQAQGNSRVQASVHYHDVDDPTNTTFAMLSMWNAGLRVVDLRNPLQPTEVGYFNPGDVDPSSAVKLDQAWGHVRYVKSTGQIWFATATGGFWVVELEPQVRAALGLAPQSTQHPQGFAGRVGVTTLIDPRIIANAAPYYCTLGNNVTRLG